VSPLNLPESLSVLREPCGSCPEHTPSESRATGRRTNRRVSRGTLGGGADAYLRHGQETP